MLKKASSIVLSRSFPSTYQKKYASGPSLPAALLESLFEHPIRLHTWSVLFVLLPSFLFYGCGTAPVSRHIPATGYPIGYVERGVASWYGPGFHGRKTANGETYDMHQLTAAHRTLPLGSVVQVRSLTSGRTVTVRVNDRGPFAKNRILDLSQAGAQALSMIGNGTDQVEIKGLWPIRVGQGPWGTSGFRWRPSPSKPTPRPWRDGSGASIRMSG